MDVDPESGLYPALLKHWRAQRGLSQLDLAIAADVSSRHVSFLETGRSRPSGEMVLRLAATLDVPLRHANAMLRAAGHPAAYDETPVAAGLPDDLRAAVDQMKDFHEPHPLVVLDRAYDVLDLNEGALGLLGPVAEVAGVGVAHLNLARLTFHEVVARDVIVNFDEVGRSLLWRIQREVLAEPDDGPLRVLLDELLAAPTVVDDWRQVDLAAPSSPVAAVHLRTPEGERRYVTAVTAFQAPQSVTADELRIETWYPVPPG